jgi:hypothetical protein
VVVSTALLYRRKKTDAVPSHAYLRMLYKYPQQRFPYEELRAANRGRPRADGEFELLDTSILAENRYFDVFVEYAKADEADILMRVTVHSIGLWSESDKFFHDVLNLPDGTMQELKLRSMVGLTPLFAVETIGPDMLRRLPRFARRLLSLLRGHRIKRLLVRMLDPAEFLSDHGIRSLSRIHADIPYVFETESERIRVEYEPGESQTYMFGGNSNWRGPVWMPMNYLIVEALERFHHYYGNDFLVECPTGSGRLLPLRDIADEVSSRLIKLFLRDPQGCRPIHGDRQQLQSDPHFCDHVWFYEYFHGDTGAGLGASHQTGWTGLVANLLQKQAQRRK